MAMSVSMEHDIQTVYQTQWALDVIEKGCSPTVLETELGMRITPPRPCKHSDKISNGWQYHLKQTLLEHGV